MTTTHSPQQQDFISLLRAQPNGANVTLFIIGVNVFIFILMLKFGAGLWHSPNGVQLAWGANFGPATKDGEWWRLATAMFLHFGLLHLAMNMAALFDSGRLVERMFGHVRFATLYLLSGLFGNLLSLFVQGNHAVSGGASGAIFGVYGGLIIFLWRHRREVHPEEFKWLFGGAILFSCLTLVLGFSITGIDNAAHIGGLVAGIVLGVVLEPHPHGAAFKTRINQWFCAILMMLSVVAMFYFMPSASYHWNKDQHAQVEITKFLSRDAVISQRWQDTLQQGQAEGLSFDKLAGKIEQDVALPYEKSFNELSAINLEANSPSAESLDNVRRYIEIRRNASKSLVKGLRTKNLEQIQNSLREAQTAAKVVTDDKTKHGQQ
jgi:rhomboid protease GluP